MKLGWLSDIHLNFLNAEDHHRFFQSLASLNVDGWLLSGDIGESDSIVEFLEAFRSELSVPTYFVLGNHDFYYGSLASVRDRVAALVATSEKLVWLTAADPVRLTNDVILLGDDTWSDGRIGNAYETPVELNDFYKIEELSGRSRHDLVQVLNNLGDESADRLKSKLESAAATCRKVIIVLHVPPFKGATWHLGMISSPDWLPWFSCKAVGDTILQVAAENPETLFTVLCGHTHSSGEFSPLESVQVYTASAEYGKPRIQGVLDTEQTKQLSMV